MAGASGPVLRVSDPTGGVREVELERGGNVLGRDDDCDVRLEDDAVSRHHLELIVRGSSLLATDLHSRNGSLVNGTPLTETRRLRSGDVIRLGAHQLEVVLPESERHDSTIATPGTATRTLATVLFTDIVGSTERAASLGDARWRELLDQHDTEARVAVARFGGRAVKMTGDGLLATFESTGEAIRCAGAFAEALARHHLELRAGIHTGECELRAGDIGGITVHTAARVMGLAEPGEVLVTETVRDLAPPDEFAFADRGKHALRGIPGEWRLHAAAPS